MLATRHPGWFVEGDAQSQIPRRGDGGDAAGERGNFSGETVGPAMTAQQGDGAGTVLRQGNDRRLRPFIARQRSQGPN